MGLKFGFDYELDSDYVCHKYCFRSSLIPDQNILMRMNVLDIIFIKVNMFTSSSVSVTHHYQMVSTGVKLIILISFCSLIGHGNTFPRVRGKFLILDALLDQLQ